MSDNKNSVNDYSLIKPNVKALIGKATKKSFHSSSDLDFSNQSTSSIIVNEKSDLVHTPSCTPLLQRQHFNDSTINSTSTKKPLVRSKWSDFSGKPIIIPSYDSASDVTSSTLLSKVDVYDDIEFDLDDITPSTSWDNLPPKISPTMDLNNSHLSDSKNSPAFDTITYILPQPPVTNSHDDLVNYAAAGDMTYFTAHSKPMQPLLDRSSEINLEKRDNKNQALKSSVTSSLSTLSSQSTSSVQTSYTVNDPTFSSLNSARAAGYPVITTSSDQTNISKQTCNTFVSNVDSSKNLTLHTKDCSNLSEEPVVSLLVDKNIIHPKLKESVNFGSADLGKYYSNDKKKSIAKSMSRSQVSEQFNQLLHDLEIVRLNALKYDEINHGDITKAVELLRNAKSNSDETSITPNKTPIRNEYSTSQIREKSKDCGVGLNGSSNTTMISLDQNESSSLISNKTYNKSNVVLPTQDSSNSHPDHKPTKSPVVKKIAFEESHKKSSNIVKAGSTRNESSFSSPTQEISYDTFSYNVKTSSCFSTPSKSSTEHHSLINDDVQDQEDGLKATRFVILDEKTPPGKLAKKKEQFLRGRLKKEEEHRKIQMEREMEAAKRKIEAKEQQEKLLQKKLEEKEKRNKIFKDYQKRKWKEETAAVRNPGVIGSSSPSTLVKKSPFSKKMSFSSDHLHMLGRIGSNRNVGSPHLTIPTSARVINHITPKHHHFGVEEDSDSLGSGGSAEYSGPKLYKQLRSKSNRILITNAINHCCLSGKVNEKIRIKTLQALEGNNDRHLMVLFRDNNCQYRALYSYQPVEERLYKICGNGPNLINPSMIEALYKYNSGRRAFMCVPSKTLSVSTDGITIKNSLWHHAIKK